MSVSHRTPFRRPLSASLTALGRWQSSVGGGIGGERNDGSHSIAPTPSGNGERRSVELRAYNCVFVSSAKRVASLAPPPGLVRPRVSEIL